MEDFSNLAAAWQGFQQELRNCDTNEALALQILRDALEFARKANVNVEMLIQYGHLEWSQRVANAMKEKPK